VPEGDDTAPQSDTPVEGSSVERQWGPYTIVEELGSGGMAVVYRARHEGLQRDFALKVIRRSFGDSLEAHSRFRLEAQAAAALGDHPGIVAAHDVGEAHGRLYLVMDLVDGRPLDEVFETGDFDHTQVARWCAEAARAVHHAHTRGILHRDLKPANLLITHDGRLRLTDFGLARLSESTEELTRLTQAGALLGTPQYMPPEQARGEPLDRRADVYSLGATLYHALAGRAPFLGDAVELILFKVINEEPAPPSKLTPDVPADLETIALRCLEKLPEDRYPTAEALADDLERFARGEPIAARRRSALSRVARWAARHRAAVAASLLLTAAAAAAGGTLYVQELRLLSSAQQARADAEAAAKQAEADRAADLQRRLAARPHEDRARTVLARMDRLRMTTDWNAEQLAGLAAEARESLHRALELLPGDPALLFAVARSHRLAGDAGAYEALLDRLTETAPDFAPGRLARAFHHLNPYEKLMHRRGELSPEEQARAEALRKIIDTDIAAAKANQGDATALDLAASMRLFVEADYAAAAERLTAVANRTVSDAHAWYWAGHAWSHVPGRTQEALEALEQALRFRPRDRRALLLRSSMLARQGSPEASAEQAERMTEREPDNPNAWFRLGKARAQLADFKGAIAACDRALALNADHAEALSIRGMSHIAMGRINAGVADLERSVAVDPENYDTRSLRATVRSQVGDLEGALKDAEWAVRTLPDDPRSYTTRGMVRIGRKEYDLAIADYDQALRLQPDAPNALHFRGLARMSAGDFAGAIPDFEAAMKQLKPTSQLYRKTVQRMAIARRKLKGR
jgi:serine/threonine-protein kinase